MSATTLSEVMRAPALLAVVLATALAAFGAMQVADGLLVTERTTVEPIQLLPDPSTSTTVAPAPAPAAPPTPVPPPPPPTPPPPPAPVVPQAPVAPPQDDDDDDDGGDDDD